MMSPLIPTHSLLCKLGSLAVHLDELTSDTGHAFDRVAVQSILNDGEVRQWLVEMGKMSLIPVKR